MNKLIVVFIIVLLIALPVIAQSPTGVTAEALAQANLRATTDVNSNLVGQIEAGTPYPVLGRSEFYPWLLLADPATQQPLGWVFSDLVTVQGNINTLPFMTNVIDASTAPPPGSTSPPVTQPSTNALPTATQQLFGVSIPVTPMPSPTPDFSNTISGRLSGEVNIRLGPGTDYDRVGVARAGDQFEIIAWHTQLPWLQIRYDASPNQLAWVARDLVEISGDINSLPALTQTVFNLPTLTPTVPALETESIFGTPVPLSSDFIALGTQLWDIVLTNGFDPATSRFGSLFVMDLQTGETLSFMGNVAFSGTSIQKIAILTRLYGSLNAPPDTATAIDIANTMICSTNEATNDLLRIIGNGNAWTGAAEVTSFSRQLGLQNTFITAPYTIPGQTPEPPTHAVEYPQTEANQGRTGLDISNQITVAEIGQLLGSVYQCAYQDTGPLLEKFGTMYEPRECRQILHVMSNNNVDALLRAGVPEDIQVAHKHGWIDTTHANAAVFFTPGGDYVIAMALHEPVWLNYQESLPTIAEVSRIVYNHYNPDTPLEAVREGFIPDAVTCNFAGTPLIDELKDPLFNF